LNFTSQKLGWSFGLYTTGGVFLIVIALAYAFLTHYEYGFFPLFLLSFDLHQLLLLLFYLFLDTALKHTPMLVIQRLILPSLLNILMIHLIILHLMLMLLLPTPRLITTAFKALLLRALATVPSNTILLLTTLSDRIIFVVLPF
jgi:hypothetical protein